MTLNTHFSQRDWERIEHDWTAWWAGEINRPMIMINGVDLGGKIRIGASMAAKSLGLKPYHLMDLFSGKIPSYFDLDTPVEKIIDAYTVLLSQIRCYGDAWPRWWPDFGPGIAAGFLGSNVNADENTVWFDLDKPIDLTTWHPEYDPENVWFKRVQTITQSAVARWKDQVNVGITDLGGNLDILAALRVTQQLLIDTIEDSESLQRCAVELTQVWLRYYQDQLELTNQSGRGCSGWAHLWAPGPMYMLQCDFSYMISPRMFKRFVMPDLAACCEHMEYPFYHLDGKGEIAHLKHLLTLDRLRGIQWIPGDGAPPPEQWLDLLKQILDGGKRCQVYVTAEGALTLARELGGKGMAICVTDPLSARDAEGLLKEMKLAGGW